MTIHQDKGDQDNTFKGRSGQDIPRVIRSTYSTGEEDKDGRETQVNVFQWTRVRRTTYTKDDQVKVGPRNVGHRHKSPVVTTPVSVGPENNKNFNDGNYRNF